MIIVVDSDGGIRIVRVEEPHQEVLCLEYMANGSLERHISDECSGLNWHLRYGIIKGSCEGLRYLHEELESPIIHMGLAPSTILLDENMIPKIGGIENEILNSSKALLDIAVN
uniref:Cysteine-rich receptor-like protein kinase 27 n=1 Tax=Aegilops tauschii TaxID=37682 RepID=R7WE86_AEGTA